MFNDQILSPEEMAKQIIKENKELPTWVQICHFIAFCEYASAGQIEKYLARKGISDGLKALRKTRADGLITKIHRNLLQSKKSLAEFADEEIYHISKKGLYQLNLLYPDLGEEINRTTEPKLKSLKHSLVIAESLLFYQKKYEIVSLASESRLRSDKVSERWKRYQRLLNFEETHALGDYKVCLFNPQTEEIFVKEAEATIRYSAKAMFNKPKGMDWFSIDEKETKRVKIITDAPCYTLSITASSSTKKLPLNQILNAENILNLINFFGGVVSRSFFFLNNKSLNEGFYVRLNSLLAEEKLVKFSGYNIGKNYGTLFVIKELEAKVTENIFQIKWVYEMLLQVFKGNIKLYDDNPQENYFLSEYRRKKLKIELHFAPVPHLKIISSIRKPLLIFADPMLLKDSFLFTKYSEVLMERAIREHRDSATICFAVGSRERFEMMQENPKIKGYLYKI
jgi:hypothetical protein